jgi:exoribonuclease-2
VEATPQKDSLVLYKARPARVKAAGKKLEIELAGGESLLVRPKDVALLHPGPVGSLAGLKSPDEGEIRAAWELLAGGETDIAELAELAHGAYTPAAALSAWAWVAEGLYFHGSPDRILARTPAEVASEQALRQARADEERAWAEFIGGLARSRLAPDATRFLREVEDLALGRVERSRVLRELGHAESPESAHALLLKVGYWAPSVNPYPQRLAVPASPPPAEVTVPELSPEPRMDLTHLVALAIDDEGNEEPDDALSLEGSRLWVHIADVAALVPPDSPADLEARARGSTLYLPDGPVPMLPPGAIERLGLGLAEVSPALSFGLELDGAGELRAVEIVPSWVRVTRLTYEEAASRLDQEPLRGLDRLASRCQERRLALGAVCMALPEVRIWLEGERVKIRPILPLRSREVVTEAMLMAGEAAARFALERQLPLPFTTQDSPGTEDRPQDLAGMFALRRSLRPSEYSSVPGRHAGLGLPAYAQATSPLRRYLDLVVHQQIRAWLRGVSGQEGVPAEAAGAAGGAPHASPLGTAEIVERVGATAAAAGAVRSAERLSRLHWTLVYLLQNPGWQGEGVLVDRFDVRGTVVIPELALDARMHVPRDLPLNSRLRLSLAEVTLPSLAAHFRLEG